MHPFPPPDHKLKHGDHIWFCSLVMVPNRTWHRIDAQQMLAENESLKWRRETHQTIKLIMEFSTKTLRNCTLLCPYHALSTLKTGSRYPYFIHSFYLKPFHFPACFNHPDSWLLGLSSLYYLQSPLGLLLEMFRALAFYLVFPSD